ncbi:tetratricopeptide repeat protein [Rhodovulum sp. DZ06]|uniref:tetratricopeptide repeat protein n=1 Tax=Rhodovulum sp. DZ06 TaxID=3425126 RepID=UPI003D33BFF9
MTIKSRIRIGFIAGVSALALMAFDTAEERADAHYFRGVDLVEQGADIKAQLEFRNALKLNKEHLQARYAFAKSLRRTENIRGAVGQLLAVVDIDDTFVPARLDLGEIFLLANRAEDAERHIDVAMKLAPDNPRARAMMATVEFKRGETDRALERADGVLLEAPDNVTARLVKVAYAMDGGDLRKAMEEVDAGIALNPDDLSLNVVKLGIAEQLQDSDAIGDQLKSLVEMFPETNQFRTSLAQWHMGQGNTDEAEAQFRALADNNPEEPTWTLDLARFLASVKGRDAAREELVARIASDHPHAEYQFAVAALDMGDGDEASAVDRLREVASQSGDTEDGYKARIEIARFLIRNDRREEAFDEIDYVLSKDPRNVDALGIRAARFIEADRPDLAIEDLRAALDSAPEDVRLLQLLATAYERAGNRELAMERLAQAATVSKYDPQATMRYVQELLSEGKTEVVESLLRDALQAKPDNRDFKIAYAQRRLAKEDWREVQRIGEELRRANPEDPAADRLLAASLVGQKMFTQSIDVLSGAVEQSGGKDVGAMLSLVRTYIASGQVDEAQQYLDQFIAENPGNPAGLVLLGSLQAARGMLDEAEASFLEVIEKSPETGIAYASLATIYQRKGDEAAALDQIRSGLEETGNDNLRLALAMRLEAAGDIDGAIETYETLYARRSDSAIVANNLASMLAEHRADDPEAVERAVNIARRFQNAGNPYMQDTYGWLLHLQGKNEQAIPHLQSAAEKLPRNGVVQFHTGVVYEAMGQTDRAFDYLSKAIAIAEEDPFPGQDKARDAMARVEKIRAGQTREGAAAARGAAQD